MFLCWTSWILEDAFLHFGNHCKMVIADSPWDCSIKIVNEDIQIKFYWRDIGIIPVLLSVKWESYSQWVGYIAIACELSYKPKYDGTGHHFKTLPLFFHSSNCWRTLHIIIVNRLQLFGASDLIRSLLCLGFTSQRRITSLLKWSYPSLV